MYDDANRENKKNLNIDDLKNVLTLRKSRIKDNEDSNKTPVYKYVGRVQRENWIELMRNTVSKPENMMEKQIIVQSDTTVLASYERDVPKDPIIYTTGHNVIKTTKEDTDNV